MPTRNALRDVDPVAITLCKKGANRQTIFLRKTQPPENELLTLPGGDMPLLRKTADDWSAFYCVVAVPGAEEDPGLVGDADSVDVWESEDEIRHAAHRLLKNGAYVNSTHDGEPNDCAIVESAVALADFDVIGPDGAAFTIRKGSWYVAIEPTGDLRTAVEDGTVEAVSIEGTGVRVAVEKAKAPAASHRTCASCGAHLSKTATTCPNCGAKWSASAVKKDADADARGWLRKLWEKAMGDEPLPDQLRVRKEAPDFTDRIAAADLRESMWSSWDALTSVIYDAFSDDDVDDPQALIRASIDQFRDHLIAKLDGDRGSISKELATVNTTIKGAAQEDADVDDKAVKEQIEQATAPLAAAIQTVGESVATLVQKVEAATPKPEPTADDLREQIGTMAESIKKMGDDLTELVESVEAIAEGDSTQDEQPEGGPVQKSANPLAGILFG